jgi:hypothetical protein
MGEPSKAPAQPSCSPLHGFGHSHINTKFGSICKVMEGTKWNPNPAAERQNQDLKRTPAIIIVTHQALSGIQVRAVFNRDARPHLVFYPFYRHQILLGHHDFRSGGEPY